MSEILQIISQDPQTGEPRYTDIGDFEEKCFRGADEPGLIFWQTMMLDFLDRSREPEEYLESGSVLPGFDNGFEHYLSQERAESCPAFQVVFCPEADAENAYYALSTVQPSRLALGGGMVLSYDPETDALTEEEAAAKDRLFIGDQVRYLMIPEEE